MLTFSHFHYRPKRGIQQGRFAAKIAAYDAILRGQTKRVSKGVIDMCDTAFWRGMAAGMAAGAIIGMTVAEKRKAMKTCVGRTMQQMGTAVDGALSDLMHR
jgi:hypothetical protein